MSDFTLDELKKRFTKLGIEYYVTNIDGTVASINFLIREDNDIETQSKLQTVYQ
tara:strand:+ start:1262 stop:1423 length:162 start_codon:yes stop_codon:yes gene_type:complete